MALLRSRLLYAVLFLVSVTMLGFVMFSLSNIYDRAVTEDLLDYAEDRLSDHVRVQKAIVLDIFRREVMAVEIIAEALEHVSDPQVRLDLIKSYTEKSGYDSMLLSDLAGKAMTNRDVVINVSGRAYFKKVLETKKTVISDPISSQLDGPSVTIVRIASPVLHKGEMVAVVAGSYNSKYVTSILHHSFNGKVHDIVGTIDENPIAVTMGCGVHSKESEIMDIYRLGEFAIEDGYDKSFEESKETVRLGLSGKAKIRYKEMNYLSIYEPLGINDWVISSIAPYEDIGVSLSATSGYLRWIIGAFVVSLLLVGGYLLYVDAKIARKLVLAFVFTAWIGSLSGLFGAWLLRQNTNDYATADEIHNTRLENVIGIGFAVGDLRYQASRLLRTPKEFERRNIIQRMKDARELINFLRPSVKHDLVSEGVKRTWTEFEQSFSGYEEQSETLFKSDDTEYTMNMFTYGIIPLLNECNEALTKLVDLSADRAQNRQQTLRNNALSALYSIVALTIFAVIASCIFAAFIAKSINSPLRNITEAAMRIANNDTNFELQERFDQDEIGVVAKTLNDHVKPAFTELSEQRERVRHSLVYASRLQRELLPTKIDFQSAFSEWEIIWHPRDIVGGDIYYAKKFDEGTLLCVCDCTGHGTPGAMLTMLVVSALDSIVHEYHYQETDTVLWKLEEKLVNILNSSDAIIKDGLDIVVAFISNNGTVSLSSANMHTFVCNGHAVHRLKGQLLQLGGNKLHGKMDIKIEVVPYHPNNKFYIASDGLFDQIGGAEKLPFGYQEFSEIILRSHNEPTSSIVAEIYSAFGSHRGDEEQRDDITLMGFKLS